jgi:glycerol-3-phosphate acyltransferase PlsY
VFVGDLAKGAAAVTVAVLIADPGVWGVAYVATGAAMIGHAFPVFARFVGGRSILAFVGGTAVFAPLSVTIGVGVVLVVFAITRSFAWGSRAGILALPLIHIVLEGPYRTAAMGVLMTIIGIRFGMAALTDRRRAPQL